MDVDVTGMGRRGRAASGTRGRTRTPEGAPGRRARLTPPAEPTPRLGPTPALITALATQLATMLVADLSAYDRSSPPEPTAPASGRGPEAPSSVGPAAAGGADGA
jgi:hypothetical protein